MTKKTRQQNVEQKEVKDFIKDYLENNFDDLKNKIQDLTKAEYADNPPRIIITSLGEIPESIVYNGIPIRLETKAADTIFMGVKNKENKPGIIPGNKNDDDVFFSHFSKQSAKNMGIKEVIGIQGQGKNKEAHQKWLQRNKKAFNKVK